MRLWNSGVSRKASCHEKASVEGEGLDQVQKQHADLLVGTAGGSLPALAEEDEGIYAFPTLDDAQSLADLALQLRTKPDLPQSIPLSLHSVQVSSR